MIGRLDGDKFFEFRGLDDLIKPFDLHASKYNSDGFECNIIIITNAQDKVKCIIANANFLVKPNEMDLVEDTNYYVRFVSSGRFKVADLNLPEKNEEIPTKYVYETKHNFKFYNRPYPKELD